MLIGTAWFAVWGALLSWNLMDAEPVFRFPYLVAAVLLPFVAIGAILGNAKGGAIFGICLFLLIPVLFGLVTILFALYSKLAGY